MTNRYRICHVLTPSETIRDLFVMCSRHQSYLSCSFERLQQVSATAFARFASVSVCFIASLLLFCSFIFVIFVAYL